MPKMRLVSDIYPTSKNEIGSVTVGKAYSVDLLEGFARFRDDGNYSRCIDASIFEPITEPTGDSKPVSQTQFSFEKFQYGATVVTRRGDKVEHVAKFEGGNLSHPIVAYLHGRPYLYSEKGENLGSSDLDLLIAPRKVWINLYGNSKFVASGESTHSTKSEGMQSGHFAKEILHAHHGYLPYLTTIEVEVPE